jgi:hypothetical protein
MKNYSVDLINYDDCIEWFLKKHYARRIPPVNFAFGLFEKNDLVGVCSYGVPSSSPLRRGIAGEKWKNNILELNRFVLENNKKNEASYFISKTLRLIPRPRIIVSYSDCAMGHHGYIYQACNFIYTGFSAKRTDWKLKGFEHLHGQTVADMSRGAYSRADFMREKYGDDFYLEDRSRKHRYVYFIGTKKEKKEMMHDLMYDVAKYAKGDNSNYDSSYKPDIQQRLFL